MDIIDTTAPAGRETLETSAAKREAEDIIYEYLIDADFLDVQSDEEMEAYGDISSHMSIDMAHDIVERLITIGWRPTVAIPFNK